MIESFDDDVRPVREPARDFFDLLVTLPWLFPFAGPGFSATLEAAIHAEELAIMLAALTVAPIEAVGVQEFVDI